MRTRWTRLPACCAVAALLVLPAVATAQGYSADVELVRGQFGQGGFHTIDAPVIERPMDWRTGLVVQYQRDPVTLHDADQGTELGAVVRDRSAATLGASVDLSRRLTAHLYVPVALDWGSEVPQLAAPGAGLGDIGFGARANLVAPRRDGFSLGARAGLQLPTGRADAWLGESAARVSGGLVAMVEAGPVRVATDAGTVARPRVETEEDLTVGTEAVWSSGVRVALPAATRVAFTTESVVRTVAAELFQGRGRTSVELLGGMQVLPTAAVRVDLGAGRGLTDGYGTTDLRLLSAVTVLQRKKPAPPEVVIDTRPPPPPPGAPDIPDIPDLDPPLDPENPPPAELRGGEIVIHQQPRFVLGTARLVDPNAPVLDVVANIILAHEGIGHVVVEGHASIEGTDEYNYELALLRADTLWRALVERGVHPDRMSIRSLGETDPLSDGQDEASLQANRRVEFHVQPATEVTDWPDHVVLPWSGAPREGDADE